MSELTSFIKEFPDGKQAVAVRTRIEEDPAAVARVLGLQTATPVLMLFGGAGHMSDDMKDHLSSAFRTIADVVVRKNVTVIDGGTQSGVMALMGQALTEVGRTATHIGVLPAYAEIEPGGLVGEDISDPARSHFVLLESDEWGSEVDLMSGLGNYLSMGASSVALLVNGGEIALKDLEQAIERRSSIIVLAGSGRLADEITEAIRYPDRQSRERVMAIVREGNITLVDVSESPSVLAEKLTKRLVKGEKHMSSAHPQVVETEQRDPALVNAWERFSRYDYNAGLAKRRFMSFRNGILVLSVFAIALPIFYTSLGSIEVAWATQASGAIRILVILTPITLSILTGAAAEFKMGEKWVLLRASAETIKKEIYRFRAGSEEDYSGEIRRARLAENVKMISERLLKTSVNRAGLREYPSGQLPPPVIAKEDDGFERLTAAQYVDWRLRDQLNWYHKSIVRHDRVRRIYTWMIYIFGGVGTFLAAIQQEIWIPIVIAISASFATYLEILRVDTTLTAYSQTAEDLENVENWWDALSPAEQNQGEFFQRLVIATEQSIENEHVGWVQEMTDILSGLYGARQPDGGDHSEGGQTD